MTNEALDLLDRLTSPELAKKAELDNNRPQDRSPLRRFKADILGSGQDLQVEQRRVGNFDQRGVYLDLNVTEVYESNPPVDPGMHRLWIRLPGERRDGKQAEPNINSEVVQMMESAQLASIRLLPGRKGVTFTESTHEFSGRADTGKPDPKNPARTLWEDKTFTTYYYKLDLSGPASSNGSSAAPKSVEPSPEAIEAAFKLLGTDGMEENAFNLAASKDPVIKKDGAAISAIASGKFAADQIAAGKIVRDGQTLVAV